MKYAIKKAFIAALALCFVPALGCSKEEKPVSTEPTLIVVDSTPNIILRVPSPTPQLLMEDPESGSAEATEAPERPNGVATAEDVLPMHDSYEESRVVNEEVIGWITVPGTNIDYPVTRCDDNSYYIDHNVEKEKSSYGCIFMDFRNADPEQQKHIVLYGHNMKNGTMFHELGNYKQREFFDENRYIYFLWDGVDTEWEIFCAYTVITDYVYPIHTRFVSDQDFADVMNDTMEYAKTVSPSNVDSSITIKPTDQVITLLTCTYEYDNSRFGVMARRVK